MENYKLEELDKIPDIHAKALNYVFERNMIVDYGLWLEFGVYLAGSINRISKYTNNKNQIYGFDSFEGLPEAWVGRTEAFIKGSFHLGGGNDSFVYPTVDPHVTLVKGWYCNVLPGFIAAHNEPITFLHVDSDIYSSARDIFTILRHNIADNCVIVFDELLGYSNFENHEWKAWWEFVDENNIEFEWIGANRSGVIKPYENISGREFEFDNPASVSPSTENAALRIIKNPSFLF